MPLIHRPICPHCGSSDTVVLKTLKNILRIAGSAIVALLSLEVVSIEWRCPQCRRCFAAIATHAIKRRAGLPLDENP
jgi:hypothetical protein